MGVIMKSFFGVCRPVAMFALLTSLASNVLAVQTPPAPNVVTNGPITPEILTQPVGQIGLVGGTATFSVLASGTGPLKYQWLLAGKNIARATSATLTLTNLQAAQFGYYEVTVTSPYGVTNSTAALLTLSTPHVIVYKYSGTATLVATNKNFAFGYSGYMYYQPATTNFTYVGWTIFNGKKLYWVNTNTPSSLVTIPGKPSYTVFGDAGASYNDLGQGQFNSDVIKGADVNLNIGTKQTIEFPSTFTGESNHVYPDPNTGEMDLNIAASTSTYAASVTQSANNAIPPQTMQELVTAEVQTLTNAGYLPNPLPY
jgi:hypothetical protein